MFSNLKNELIKKDISVKQFGEFLGVSEKTASNKLNGITEFTYGEFYKTCKFLFPEYNAEFLFKRDDTAA